MCILATGLHVAIIVVSCFLICDLPCPAGYNHFYIYLSATQATVVTRASMPNKATEVLPVVTASNRVVTTVVTKPINTIDLLPPFSLLCQ